MSYEALAITWFGIWGLLWAVYFMLDGFDLGVGMLYPFLTKEEGERRLLLNTIGPFWDGNEVWLVTAGGATFAAFPTTYAMMFSYFYVPLMLVLFGLIIRGSAIEFMNKSSDESWLRLWKWGFAGGSFAVSFILGAIFANIFRGLPIDVNGYHGSFLTFFNLYALAGGFLFTLLFLLSGTIWIAVKTKSPLSEKALSFASRAWYVLLLVLILFLIYTYFGTNLFSNYFANPIWRIVPLIVVGSLILTKILINKKQAVKAFFSSSLTIVATTFFAIIGLYPNMIPSSLDPNYSLTLFNSSSSQYTLKIMLIVVIIFIPIVISYQIFIYKVFSDKVSNDNVHY